MKWHGNSSSENFLEAWGAFVVTNSPQRLSHPGRRHTEMEGVSGGGWCGFWASDARCCSAVAVVLSLLVLPSSTASSFLRSCSGVT